MAADPQVKVSLTLDSKQYEQALKSSSKHMAAVDESIKKSQKSAGRAKSDWTAMGAAITVAGGAAVIALKKAVDAASNLNESTTKMRTIFGAASKDIERFAQTSASSLGMSKQAAYDAASMMATFGKAAGLTGGELTKFSTEMVSLSSDLASFFNSSPDEAMQAIGAALRGESEPIRRYGVLLDDATLRNRALEMGIISNIKNALTPQQKALAAQAEILAQTSDAQGDFARTSDGLANSQRQMSAAMENAQAALGEALLPVMTKGVKAVGALAEGFSNLPKPVRDSAAGLALTAAAIATLGPASIKVVQGVKATVTALGTYTTATTTATVATDALAVSAGRAAGAGGLAALAKTAGIIGVGIAALGGIVVAAKNQIDGINSRALDEMVASIKEAETAGRALGSTLTVTFGGGEVATGIEEIAAAAGRSGTKAKEAAPAFAALDQYLSELSADDAATAYRELQMAVGGSGMSVADLNAMLPTYIAKQKEAAGAAGEQTDAEKEKAEAVKKANEAQQTAIDLIFGYINAQMAAAGAADALLGAQDRLTKAHKANGDTLSGTSAKSVANREALRSEMGMVLANAQAKIDAAKASGADTVAAYEIGTKAVEKGKEALIKAAEAAGYSKKEVKKLIDQYTLVPPTVETKVDATGVTAAENEVKAYKRLLDNIPASVRTTVIAHYKADKGIPQGAASGGKIVGPGTGTSDSIPAMLSNGEWVVPAKVAGRLGDDYMAALVAGDVAGYATGGRVLTPKQRAAAAAAAKRKRAAAAKKRAAAAKASRDAAVDDIEWQFDMGMIDLPTKISAYQGQLRTRKPGSDEAKDLMLLIKQAQDDYRGEQEDAAAQAAQAQIEAAEEQQAAAADAEAAARKVYTDAMKAFEHNVAMGADGFGTAAQQLEQLNKIQATNIEDEWALAERKHALEQQIIAEQEAAAKAIRDQMQAAAQALADKAKGIAEGVVGALGLGQTQADGKKWSTQAMLGDFANRAMQAKDFASMVGDLSARGLSEDVIQQVLAAGPVAGADMARALSRMSKEQIATVNARQAEIRAGGQALGNSLTYGTSVKLELSGGAPIVLKLDSKSIYEGQLVLKRQMGGTYALVTA